MQRQCGVNKGKAMATSVLDIQKTILGDFTPHGVIMSIVAYHVSLQCTKEVMTSATWPAYPRCATTVP